MSGFRRISDVESNAKLVRDRGRNGLVQPQRARLLKSATGFRDCGDANSPAQQTSPGHYAGAAFVAIGSEIGAMLAFLIARYLGRDALGWLLKGKQDYGLLGSQNSLTLIVFFSRLLPFVSFDAVSYAAGLSKIHFWRFLLATLAGILPASFLLAHFGAAAISGEFGSWDYLILGLGLLTAVPLLLAALRRGRGQ